MIAVLIYRFGWAVQRMCFTIADRLDPKALGPEIERQRAKIRDDLD